MIEKKIEQKENAGIEIAGIEIAGIEIAGKWH